MPLDPAPRRTGRCRAKARAAMCIAAAVLAAVLGTVMSVGPSAAQDEVPLPPELPPTVTLARALSQARTCPPDQPTVAWARLPRTLRTVPLRQMIGQLLVVSYVGTGPDSTGVESVRQALRRSRVGGVLTFRHNIASADAIRAVNARFADAHPVLPAMIAIDQEGGAVMRVKPSEGAPATPSAADIARRPLQEAEAAYAAMAKTLADLGFTANFGPVVDLAVNPENPVIARFGRSYGASVDTVVRYAQTFIEAHRAAGVATALKHFPGHGSSSADSHDSAIDLSPTWSEDELEPFRRLIDRGAGDMVMIGHLELDGMSGPGPLPASLSPVAITEVLRGELCFDGLVVSDDLGMEAIESRWGSAEAARLLVEAGGDLALLALPAENGMAIVGEIIDHLEAAAADSPEFAEKIRRAYTRVVHHKLDIAAIRAAHAADSPAPRVASAAD